RCRSHSRRRRLNSGYSFYSSVNRFLWEKREMKINFVILSLLILTMAGLSLGQPPHQPGPPPPGAGPGPGEGDWAKSADTDKNGSVDATEFQAAIDRTFAALDKNGNGGIDPSE